MGNQQVSWWDVHTYVTPLLAHAGPHPTIGTPAWCALPPHHPAKTAAILDAAQHWALHLETCQQNHADASRAISAAADWATISRHITRP